MNAKSVRSLHRLLPAICFGLVASMAAPGSTRAQSQELGLTLGGIVSQTRSATDGTKLSLDSATALEANYAHRIFEAKHIELLIGAHFLANGARSVESPTNAVPSSLATLYVTPDLVVKFSSHARFQPWLTLGGGYAQYESGQKLQDGTQNTGGIRIHRGTLVYGGGVDVPIIRYIALRAEIRDFYSGSPQLNVPLAGGQHNVVAGGGFVLRFGK